MSKITLSVQSLSDQKTYELTEPIYRIGRNESNDIVINDKTASAFHVCLVRQGEQYLAVHCDDSPKSPNNQVYINGKILQLSKFYITGEIIDQAQLLYHKDNIRLSPSILLKYRHCDQ